MNDNPFEETFKAVQRCNKRIAKLHDKREQLKEKRKETSGFWYVFLEILIYASELIFYSLSWIILSERPPHLGSYDLPGGAKDQQAQSRKIDEATWAAREKEHETQSYSGRRY